MVQWLLDSFSRGSLLSEGDYYHPACLPPAPSTVAMPAPRTSASRPSSTSAAPLAHEPATPRHRKAEEDMLSQYMDDDQTVGKGGAPLCSSKTTTQRGHSKVTSSLVFCLCLVVIGDDCEEY